MRLAHCLGSGHDWLASGLMPTGMRSQESISIRDRATSKTADTGGSPCTDLPGGFLPPVCKNAVVLQQSPLTHSSSFLAFQLSPLTSLSHQPFSQPQSFPFPFTQGVERDGRDGREFPSCPGQGDLSAAGHRTDGQRGQTIDPLRCGDDSWALSFGPHGLSLPLFTHSPTE